ncbi:cysteine synthase A [Fictibacillus barbaricus]|uniref:Cysteine synthase n=1 Tax=Fictibacillus barbaricus TaxID=182136 RepID=A0ABU1U449_9BACL|nr:cysteine synthase A [Fictibacillus barbaricus]MDR7074217.1 cysteine synthase A [Fictibacillus barbaricus]
MQTKSKEKIFNSVLELIGNTPLVKLNKINNGADILAKLEMYNPTSSVKDRIGLTMIESAEHAGMITPGKTVIIEPTSGNTGISLALVGLIKGYRVMIVMPDSMSVERIKMMQSLGATVILTPGAEGFLGTIEKAKNIRDRTPDSWLPLQFENPYNPIAHLKTGEEIWRDTAGKIDVLVAGVGTGGTLSGTAEHLKKYNPNIKVIAVEPEECALLTGGNAGLHRIQGLLGGFIAKTTDLSLIDEVIPCSSENALETMKELTKQEGLFVGISSGAAMWAAREISKRSFFHGKRIVVIFPDSGERYLSVI